MPEWVVRRVVPGARPPQAEDADQREQHGGNADDAGADVIGAAGAGGQCAETRMRERKSKLAWSDQRLR
jgi:hypothetical protein